MHRFWASTALALLAILFLFPAGCSDTGGDTPDPCSPISDAGDDLTGQVGTYVVLSGSARLEDETRQVCKDEKESLQYVWEQVSGADVEIEGTDQREASFLPMEAGDYSFRFQVIYPITDVNKEAPVESQWDTVNVTVAAVDCDPPTTDAGGDQNVTTIAGQAATVTLDGSASQADSQTGCDLTLTCAWTVESQPTGSDVTITNADQAVATVDVTELGDYVFKLTCTDSDSQSSEDTITVTLLEKPPCEATLEVTVVNSFNGEAVANADVAVVDADGTTHTATADASGVATFDALAAGNRQSITASSSETVPAHPQSGESGDRPRYEITTILDNCNNALTIPLNPTGSGSAAEPAGTLTAKMPTSIFSMLPHSWKCVGACSSDADCDETYYCETGSNSCSGLCTPRSMLPFFGLGDPNTSGQMRMAVVVPVFPQASMTTFPLERVFAKPLTPEGILPGNLASDDTFLNGLAPTLGLDPWGNTCVSRRDCPNEVDYSCDEDPNGDYRCKDKSPLRNIKVDVPAGSNVRLAVLVGVMNVNMVELLPVLLPFMTGGGEDVIFDVGAMLGAFKLQTLHVCPFSVSTVAAGERTDISSTLSSIQASQCWSVDYQQQEDTVPILDANALVANNGCNTNDDCGWPGSGQMCLENPADGDKYCLIPMFRVKILTDDTLQLNPADSGLDRSDLSNDARLCSQLPDTAVYKVQCEDPETGVVGPCDPPVTCDLDVPGDCECQIPYGLALTGIDFPPGHMTVPDGGRIITGFNLNRTPISAQTNPVFLMPQIDMSGGVAYSGVQLAIRYLKTKIDGSYEPMEGRAGSFADSSKPVASLDLPPMIAPPAGSGLTDAGLNVMINFVPDDPTAGCASVSIKRAYAVATQLKNGTANLPGSVNSSGLTTGELVGVALSRINRVTDAEDNVYTVKDPSWRIYAPPGTASIAIPASASPFAAGEEIWLTVFEAGFDRPFDYDLFPVDLVTTRQTVQSEDSWSLKAP